MTFDQIRDAERSPDPHAEKALADNREHLRYGVHPNSLEAYFAGRLDLFSKRHQQIIEVLRAARTPLTDREIMVALGFSDANSCRPRLTELTEAGIVVERGSITCPVTGKTVRRSELRVQRPVAQFEMAEILTPEIIQTLKTG
jgi:hypothetical protein